MSFMHMKLRYKMCFIDAIIISECIFFSNFAPFRSSLAFIRKNRTRYFYEIGYTFDAIDVIYSVKDIGKVIMYYFSTIYMNEPEL